MMFPGVWHGNTQIQMYKYRFRWKFFEDSSPSSSTIPSSRKYIAKGSA